MKFYKGDKVFLIENREVAIVTRVEDENLLYVETTDGMEIPVFSSDITSDIPKEIYSGAEERDESFLTVSENNIEQSEEAGLFICLEPLMLLNEVKEFNIYLVNSFNTGLQFNFQFLHREKEVFSLVKDIPPQNTLLLYSIDYDELNENPAFVLEVKRKNMDKKELTFTQKIKPNNLFNKERTIPFFKEPVFAYQLLEHWTEPIEEKKYDKAKKLKEIEERVMSRLKAEAPAKKVNKWEPAPHEIDLHIEQLMPDYRGLSNAEIMQTQIKHFRRALERAITGGLDRFYAIHGLGKGKLRDEIFRILPEYPQVKSFRNEYHPRYGFGATEIILK